MVKPVIKQNTIVQWGNPGQILSDINAKDFVLNFYDLPEGTISRWQKRPNAYGVKENRTEIGQLIVQQPNQPITVYPVIVEIVLELPKEEPIEEPIVEPIQPNPETAPEEPIEEPIIEPTPVDPEPTPEVPIEDGYDTGTTKIPTKASKADLENIINQLSSTSGNIAVPSEEPTPILTDDGKIWVENFKTKDNTWTDAFQAAFDSAPTIASPYHAKAGGTSYYGATSIVTVKPGVYTLERTIQGKKYADFDFTGSTLVSTEPTAMVDYDAINYADKAFHNVWKQPTFIGFRRGIVWSTANIDTSTVKVSGGGYFNCKVGIDDISYQNSRSTNFELSNFYSIQTEQVARVHTDNANIHDYWVYGTGRNVPLFFSQARLKIDQFIHIPKPAQQPETNRMAWVEQWTESDAREIINHATGLPEVDDPALTHVNEKGEARGNTYYQGVGANNRGFESGHGVNGGEAGSMPMIRWFGKTWDRYNTSNALHNYIRISGSQLEQGNTGVGPAAPISIETDLPSNIFLENITGMSNAADGFVYVQPHASRKHEDTNTWRYEIYLGGGLNSVRQNQPLTNDPILHQFIRPNNNLPIDREVTVGEYRS